MLDARGGNGHGGLGERFEEGCGSVRPDHGCGKQRRRAAPATFARVRTAPTATGTADQRPLTILLLSSLGGMAGSTQSVFNLGQYLARRGHRVLLGCPPGTLLAELAARDALELPPLSFESHGALARDVRALMTRERVDVVNPQASKDRRACTLLRWRRQLPEPFLVTRRTMPLTLPPELLAIGATADRTIAVSGAVLRALVRRGHPRRGLVVVPNGIALDRVDAAPAEADAAYAREVMAPLAPRPVLLMVARRKDQEVLLRALPLVETPLAVVFAGVHADAALRPLADALPERHRALFLGPVDRPLALYPHATLAVLPSRIEGLSQALLEAMALGVPVLASDAGGNPDLVTPGETGWLAPPLDPAAWARTIEAVLRDDAGRARVAAAARRMVRTEYTLERTAEKTEAVYRTVIAERSRRGGRQPGRHA
jgi:glycosyltransferase involved in cell wall biosynthesis